MRSRKNWITKAIMKSCTTRKTLSLNGLSHDSSAIVCYFRRLSPRFSETHSPKPPVNSFPLFQ